MNPQRIAALILSAVVLDASLFSADAKAAPVGLPQPRVVQPLSPAPLPPRAADPSWLLYEEGLRLFGEKRFGESLVTFKQAIDSRASLFGQASKDIEAAKSSKEASRARNSISALVDLLAARDLIPQELESIKAKAGGSLIAEMGLLRERSPSNPLRGLIDAALLIVEERGLAPIGDSIDSLRKAAADLALYPEAEFGIGKIYLAEGESALAELQMSRAYQLSGSLELAADRFAMLEALAEIYKTQGDDKDYEQRLRDIADASELFAARDEFFRTAMERTLASQGVDKFMGLYRIHETFARKAYSELGALYLEAGRPLAVIYLAAAVDTVLTREIEEIQVDEPNYGYAGLPDLIARIQGGATLARFASDSGLWRDMTFLGEALAQSGNRDTARELWTAVTGALAPSDIWRKRAAADLLSSRNASRLP